MSNVKQVQNVSTLPSCLLEPGNIREHEKIEDHPAWHGSIDMNMASLLLEQKAPFSYILSPLPTPDTYVLSYVRQDLMVAQTIFKKGDGDHGWEYRNGDEHLCKTLDDFVCKAMHCNPSDCKPLSLPPTSAFKV